MRDISGRKGSIPVFRARGIGHAHYRPSKGFSSSEVFAKECDCDGCQGRSAPLLGGANKDRCNKNTFVQSLAFIILDTLALSLFDSPSPLLPGLSTTRENGIEMHTAISSILTTGLSASFDGLGLIRWARNLAGHGFLDEDRSLLVTSARGQVLYPRVFDTFKIEKQGYLKLHCLPGVLR